MSVLQQHSIQPLSLSAADDCSSALYNSPMFVIKNTLLPQYRAYTQTMTDNGNSTTSDHSTQTTQVVRELPPAMVKKLMQIAEKCVIKSNRISKDETPDFVQNCLLKLLLQIDSGKVVLGDDNEQYYIIKKDGCLLELEPWFGTTATNMSIDHYRRVKNHVDTSHYQQEDNSHDDELQAFLAPEPEANLEEELREQQIQAMSEYCAEALDLCMQDTWVFFTKENYKNFSLEFSPDAPSVDKGVAVATYCQLILEEKYNNDGRKINSHDTVCEGLGMVIRPENIAHKKKKFEQLMMQCVSQKVDSKFNSTTKQTLQDNE